MCSTALASPVASAARNAAQRVTALFGSILHTAPTTQQMNHWAHELRSGVGVNVLRKTLTAPVQKNGSSGLLSGQTQWAFLFGAALLALLLAGNERLCGSLDLSGLRRKT